MLLCARIKINFFNTEKLFVKYNYQKGYDHFVFKSKYIDNTKYIFYI